MIDNDVQIQAIKAAPAIGGSIYAGLTLSEWAAAATIVYVVLQIIFLVWDKITKNDKSD